MEKTHVLWSTILQDVFLTPFTRVRRNFWMDKNLHRSALPCAYTDPAEPSNPSQDGQNFLPRCRFRFSQTGVNTWTGHVFAQFARKSSYAHLISRTLVNNTTCNSNFTAPCKWLAQVKDSSAQKFVHTPLNQVVSNLRTCRFSKSLTDLPKTSNSWNI